MPSDHGSRDWSDESMSQGRNGKDCWRGQDPEERGWPYQQLDLGLLERQVRKYIFVSLSHSLCGSLLQQRQDVDTEG